MSHQTERLNTALAGRYRVDRHLGEGGMASVYLAEDVKHDRKVALKLLKPDLAAVLGADRFVQEIKTTASLQHPHILPLFDSGSADGFLYYVMPYIQGETLRDKLNRETQLGVDEAVRIAREVADALDYAHRHGVIHRDIKPENILLHDGRPMVADFGIALAVSAAAGGRMTETGLSLGTPHYMSPEQATADKEITARSDVYSIGSVLYEMLTGNPPHTGATAQQIIMKIITEPAAPVTKYRKSVPSNVAAAIARALEKLPADRFDTAKAFAEALANSAFTVASSDAESPRFLGRNRRPLIPWAIAATAIVVGIGGWLRPTSQSGLARSIRYEVPELRTSISFTGIGNPLAISPDGRYVATAGISAPGSRVLYLKSASELNPREIEGSRGARNPFFSPDSKWVVYFAGGRLWKASVSGGTSALLGEAGPGRTSWSSKGFLVQSSNGLLAKMPANGGNWEVFTAIDTAAGETAHLFPLVLADGETILYTSYAMGGIGAAKLGVASLSTGRTKVLPVAAAYAMGVIDEQLVFATSSGALMAVAFDVKSGEALGTPVAMGEQVQVETAGEAFAALSPSGDLAMMSGSSMRHLAILHSAGPPERLPLDRMNARWPRVSPDGKRIALTQTIGAQTDIWVYDLPRGPLVKLTDQGVQNDRPEWTPDGKSIIFRSNRGTTNALWIQAVDGAGEARLLIGHPRAKIEEGVVSGNGNYVVYQLDSTGVGDIWYRSLLSPDSVAHPVAATSSPELSARFSPDGKWVAYSSAESATTQVYVRPFPSMATRHQVSIDGGATPLWSRDGREIFYSLGRTLYSASINTARGFSVTSRRVVNENILSYTSIHADYDVVGDRIVGFQPTDADIRVLVVHGWSAELRARLTGK